MVSPGDTRNGAASNYAVSISKDIGSTDGYSFLELQQSVPNLVAGQTYRIEFSWKYDMDADSNDVCAIFVNFWGIQLAYVCHIQPHNATFTNNYVIQLTPSTTSSRLENSGMHYLSTMPQCGTSTNWAMTRQSPQNPGVWRRYVTHYRAPYPGSSKAVAFGLHCTAAATQTRKQTVYFDDWVITPIAAC